MITRYHRPMQQIGLIDREAMMPYYEIAKSAYSDLPDFYNIEFVWIKSFSNVGIAAQIGENSFQVGFSRPIFRSLSQMYPDQYNSEFKNTALHELSHLAMYVQGKYHAHHNGEWKREFGEAVDNPQRCAVGIGYDVIQRAKEIARTM